MERSLALLCSKKINTFLFFFCSEPLGFARNLQVTDPTTSTLNVRWDPAEGNVREYIVIWVPTAGGEQDVVRTLSFDVGNMNTFLLK